MDGQKHYGSDTTPAGAERRPFRVFVEQICEQWRTNPRAKNEVPALSETTVKALRGKAGEDNALPAEHTIAEWAGTLWGDFILANDFSPELEQRYGRSKRQPWQRLRSWLRDYVKPSNLGAAGAFANHLHSLADFDRQAEQSAPLPDELASENFSKLQQFLVRLRLRLNQHSVSLPQHDGNACRYLDDMVNKKGGFLGRRLTPDNLNTIAEAVWSLVETDCSKMAQAFWSDFHRDLKDQLHAPEMWKNRKSWLNFVQSLVEPRIGGEPAGQSTTPRHMKRKRKTGGTPKTAIHIGNFYGQATSSGDVNVEKFVIAPPGAVGRLRDDLSCLQRELENVKHLLSERGCTEALAEIKAAKAAMVSHYPDISLLVATIKKVETIITADSQTTPLSELSIRRLTLLMDQIIENVQFLA